MWLQKMLDNLLIIYIAILYVLCSFLLVPKHLYKGPDTFSLRVEFKAKLVYI